MTKKKLLLISLLSGVLQTLSWVGNMMFAPLMLLAFVPLLFVEDFILKNKDSFSKGAVFTYSYPAFFLFCITQTWWISKASLVGLVVPFFEACFMALVFQVYHFCRKVSNYNTGSYFFLILFWLLFEYVQFNWDVNFPWLNLGNTFANYPFLVQWYSITGMEGGSIWVLLCNIVIYLSLRKRKKIYIAIIVLFLPMICSACMWFAYSDDNKKNTAEVVVVQPNLDPYTEQYDLEPHQVIERSLKLIKPLMDDRVDYVLMPESAIQEYAWEEYIDKVPSVCQLNDFVNQYKKAEVIAGLSSRRLLPKGVKTQAARPFADIRDRYYESCNIVIDIPRSGKKEDFAIHHKTILTVGVEKMPFKKYLSFVEKFALNLGGTIGTLGTDSNTVVFASKTKPIIVGTAICYESVDGDYVRKFVKEGANLLFVATNDGWWGNTAGHRQHFSFSRLRAIENRRYVARSANTGISAFISPRGEVLQKTPYWQQAALNASLPLQTSQTFYTKHGDLLIKPISFFAVLLLLYSIIINKVRRKER
ncbi:MAG: apolipoprotein N-acyltransferase [Bacteroidota bacterium]|nr:apolipoprotein N-acyltransferase [Bacteroidota bacterium]